MLKLALLIVSFAATALIGFSQCNVLYVTTTGTGSGTKASPMSIQNAFATATSGTVIRLANGTYNLTTQLTLANSGVIVEGGFSAGTWVKTSSYGATTIFRQAVNIPSYTNGYYLVAINAVGKSNIEFHDLRIQTADLDATTYYGASTYCVYLNNCSNYKFVRVGFDQGNACKGANGINGANGAAGGSGQYGQNGNIDNNSGGAGGVGGYGGGVCCTTTPAATTGAGGFGQNGGRGGGGGNGGYGGSSGSAGGFGGLSGNNACNGNRGIGGGSGDPGGDGTWGSTGCAGAWGANGVTGSVPAFAAYYVPGGQGTTGQYGFGGAGGGGGGGGGGQSCTFCINGKGNGGSGGGGGGQGGYGGTGARGGGGSFGAYIINNGPGGQFVNCQYIVGNAGAAGSIGIGGNGGAGGLNAPANTYGSAEIGSGGGSGYGGSGGKGGNGGGSYNGTSQTVYLVSGSGLTNTGNFSLSTQPVITVTETTCTYVNTTFSYGGGGNWNFGLGSSPTTASGSPVQSMYSTTGFKTITNSGGGTYTDFVLVNCESTFATTNITACDSYTWTAGTGLTYTSSGMYTHTTTNAVGCPNVATLNLTINNTPVADAPANVTACDSYTLPALGVGNYFSSPGGVGPISVGTNITASQTIYVYAETGTTPNCTDENSFMVTINNTPVADAPANVTICDSYTLPALGVGNYFSSPGGVGPIPVGTNITASQTIYVYAETGTTPNCTDENSFAVTIISSPVADAPANVTACDSYTLPALSVGSYFSSPGGVGPIAVGTNVLSTQTIYVYAETGTIPNCTDENSFVVTINNTPVADAPANVTICDSYTLPALGVGNYFSSPGGVGPIPVGTTITSSQTIYVFAETATTPNCTDENSFTVTINNTPVADAPADVTACDSYTLPALSVGNYFNSPGGIGPIAVGTNVTTSQLIYVYAETGSVPNCTDENAFYVTINYSNVGTDMITACDTYTWIDGMTYTSSNSSATHTLTNVAGCDSVVTLNLTINYSNTGTDVITACDSYTWIDGITYTSSNSSATHTLTNAVGCDSIVTLNLSINYANTGTDVITACDSYTWIDGMTYTASNNTATHVLTNATGCDSTVTLDLTMNYSTTGTDAITACDTYTWIDGMTYTASNNTATHVLTNAVGCDSTVTLDLTINYSSTGTDAITACDTYTWIDGMTYTSSNNTATYVLTNAAGCDSTVTLDLTINSADASVSVVDEITFSAVSAGAAYQWLDCDNGFAIIAGETGQTFVATQNGNYAVQVTENGCMDTSVCYAVTTIGLDEIFAGMNFSLYPNPTNNEFAISFNGDQMIDVVILDMNGRVMRTINSVVSGDKINVVDLAPGSYFVRLISSAHTEDVRLVRF